MITQIGCIQILCYFLVILLLVKPLGWYMAKVYENKGTQPHHLEGLIYRLCHINPKQGMDWKQYVISMLVFNLLGLFLVFLIQQVQSYLPLNPQKLPSVRPDLALNTAASFITNTNWQAYAGESTMSYLTQMIGLTVQNFLSAATGISLLIAFTRGIVTHEGRDLGNFWVDTTRGILYILLPLSFILAIVLVSQGVIQNLKPNQTIDLVEHAAVVTQVIPMGPVASQIAIKQLGTNGGGFFNANSAHPFENPTPLTNFLEMLALLMIPSALCYTFGSMVRDKRQGWALLVVMMVLIIPPTFVTFVSEQTGNPALTRMGVDQLAITNSFPGGNMEGKETRFGIAGSTLWSTLTTASSNGSVNSALDSYTPMGSMIPLWLMQLGEVVFGGVGSGLYGMLMLVIITVFIAGLMVGRTPEYMGKKIEPFEMKMASMAVLVMPFIVLLSTALASVTSIGTGAITNPGAHGLTEILYAFTSMGSNNGSAFSGLNANTLFYNLLGSFVMLVGRFAVAIPVLAIAGSLIQKKVVPVSAGTLATHTPLFIMLLMGVTIVLGALAFLPALALGPIVEELALYGY